MFVSVFRRSLAPSIIFVMSSMAALPASAGISVVTSPTNRTPATLEGAASSARDTARSLLGNRPYQVVIMSGQRAVMNISSTGTSPLTRVPLASISKSITALVIMRLVEIGRLTLESTLGDTLPDSLVPPVWKSVTVAQLLSHTSGFGADRDRWFNDSYSSCSNAFHTIVTRDAPVSPGAYAYSNTNFCALSLIAGAVSGPSYQDAAYRLVFRPLGIEREVMDPQYANLAGAGGWTMSALDIARVVSALDPASALSPVSASTRTQMISKTSYNYGLGVWIWDEQTFGHSGSLYRARNIAVRLPSGRVVVILTQATYPESGLDLLPIAQQIDAAFTRGCTEAPCQVWGLDPFNGMPHGLRALA